MVWIFWYVVEQLFVVVGNFMHFPAVQNGLRFDTDRADYKVALILGHGVQ